MSSEEEKYFNIPAHRSVKELRNIIKKDIQIYKDKFSKKENYKKFWFISKNKEEPRLADNRFEEIGSELEQPLAIARDIKKLYEKLNLSKDNLTIDKFLIKNSELDTL